MINEAVMTRKMLETLRGTKKLINESTETPQAIAITNDPRFGQEVLKNQIEEFRSTVDGGAQFAKADPNDPLSSPLIYYPQTSNLTFSGIIPSLNNLKWQFSLKDSDGTGLFIWPAERRDDSNADTQTKEGDYKGFRLNKENLIVLNKLLGHYLNWKSQWEQSGGMLETLAKTDNE